MSGRKPITRADAVVLSARHSSPQHTTSSNRGALASQHTYTPLVSIPQAPSVKVVRRSALGGCSSPDSS